ncbi:glycosyltransferase [Sphingobacterium yanglingense]|uniref:Glycosyltransferase 2-like domain-containing protein n=1 Tax=Sphingobacterium yanglingense TaxID=1437280 RepID=A0A4R6W7V8_9SPHI|nr:glycosyltransferase family 2 protein [Sphingobacterium yanglingense]TDQ73501.1 hypothetical protein CLV99_4555 [Sphingobacterium yanglingense]
MQHRYNIIILNWNGWNDTQKCIESILNETIENNYTIVLVDNGSEVSEVQNIELYCKEHFKYPIIDDSDLFLSDKVLISEEFASYNSRDKIIFIRNNENLGFAAGNNVALKFLMKSNEQYAVLLNNDTEIVENALGKMFDVLKQNNRIAAVVPQIRYYEPNDVIWNCGGMINWLGVRKYDYALMNYNEVPQEGLKKIDYGTGCTLFLDLKQTGILTEKFFFGEEDFELAFRLRKENKDIVCLYNAIIYHKVGASRVKVSEARIGNMVYHYSQRLSNLKEQLIFPIWCLSVLAHLLSSLRLLYKEPFFKLSIFVNMWKDVLKNVKNIKKFEKSDYLRISTKKY